MDKVPGLFNRRTAEFYAENRRERRERHGFTRRKHVAMAGETMTWV